MLFKKIDDDIEKQQSQKMQITKYFKILAQFLNKTHFTSILSLNKIHFTTKFNIVISFAKRRFKLTLIINNLDHFIFFVNFSSSMLITKRCRITKSLLSI